MMMIIEVSDTTLFADMSADLQKAIQARQSQWVEAALIGTKAVNNRKLIFIDVDATKSEVEALTNAESFDDEGNQVAWDLGWTVLAAEDEQVDQSLLLPYFEDEVIYDDEGNEIDTQPISDLTGKLQTWAGREWIY